MLDEALDYLEKRSQADATFQYEVIVVSDGSKDSTVQVALQYGKKYTADKVRVLELIKNRGKGGAVRLVSFSFIEKHALISISFSLSAPTGNVECTWMSIAVCRC